MTIDGINQTIVSSRIPRAARKKPKLPAVKASLSLPENLFSCGHPEDHRANAKFRHFFESIVART